MYHIEIDPVEGVIKIKIKIKLKIIEGIIGQNQAEDQKLKIQSWMLKSRLHRSFNWLHLEGSATKYGKWFKNILNIKSSFVGVKFNILFKFESPDYKIKIIS